MATEIRRVKFTKEKGAYYKAPLNEDGYFHGFGTESVREGEGIYIQVTIAIIEHASEGLVYYCNNGEYKFLDKPEEFQPSGPPLKKLN